MKDTDLQSQSDRLHIQKKQAGEQEGRKEKSRTANTASCLNYLPQATLSLSLSRFAPILSTRQERRPICCRSLPLQRLHYYCCCCGHLRELALSSDKVISLPDSRDILFERRHPHPILPRAHCCAAVSNGLPRVRETQYFGQEREEAEAIDKFPTKQPRRFSSQTPTDRSRPRTSTPRPIGANSFPDVRKPWMSRRSPTLSRGIASMPPQKSKQRISSR